MEFLMDYRIDGMNDRIWNLCSRRCVSLLRAKLFMGFSLSSFTGYSYRCNMKDKKRNRRSSKTFKERKDGQYYTIESTEEIYSTTLSAKQRNYIDPWDLENYDYVRKWVLFFVVFFKSFGLSVCMYFFRINYSRMLEFEGCLCSDGEKRLGKYGG